VAAVAYPGSTLRTKGHLRPIRPARDLSDIADLTEIGFGDRLGRAGKDVVREMRQMASLGPLLWPLSWALKLSMGAGFVWEEEGRVVGNVSLFDAGRFPGLGQGWLIANVVVHPTYRRRGIARALMAAALEDIRRRGGSWCALQVEKDNPGAQALYESLGFQNRGLLERWEADFAAPELPHELYHYLPRTRRPHEAAQEAAIVMKARPAMIIWSRALTPGEVRGDWLWSLGRAFGGAPIERLVIDDPDRPGEALLGSAWIEGQEYRGRQVSLFYDTPPRPEGLRHEEARLALAYIAVRRAMAWRGGPVAVEHAGEDPAIEEFLRRAGFRLQRELIQMWRSLDGNDAYPGQEAYAP
jgi:ribosomal protein S18 acetylase RimI-like enzyme